MTVALKEHELAGLNLNTQHAIDVHFLREWVEIIRLDVCRRAAKDHKGELGQFLTARPIADLMASMMDLPGGDVELLDAGAGIGSLTAAFVSQMCMIPSERRPPNITVTAYEVDPLLLAYLEETLELCTRAAKCAGIEFYYKICDADFIEEAVTMLDNGLFAGSDVPRFTAAIQNPPYKKINSASTTRALLRRVGVETTNLYAGFIALTIKLLAPGGVLAAITPRSFCNGPYFRPFRELILSEMCIRRIHVFDSRLQTFRDDDVLQETVIMHAVKARNQSDKVVITSSPSAEDETVLSRELRYSDLVHPGDPQKFIHIVPDEMSQRVVERMRLFRCSLDELGIEVSTGRVVDFRAAALLREKSEPGTVPLIYPVHFSGASISWPKVSKKPNALALSSLTPELVVPTGNYVLVKRFSSKEEKKRIVAAVFQGARFPAAEKGVGFENHLNYFHEDGRGLDLMVARGLAAYLNSSLVDSFFRQFNGHTQVNATDLRTLSYPDRHQLLALAEGISEGVIDQSKIDQLIEQEVKRMPDSSGVDPIAAKKRVSEALDILVLVGVPREQQNERSALALLALLNLTPETAWCDAEAPLIGITPIMDFAAKHYGKQYAPNSRETFRRFTIHQFVAAGLAVSNPDDPTRPTNSPKWVYQIQASALELVKTYGTADWEQALGTYLESVITLRTRYAQERDMERIPVTIAPGRTITLSPGGQNILVEQVIKEFGPRFTPGGEFLYIGDTDDKFAYFNEKALTSLGVRFDSHGKMPDLIIHYTSEEWLVLIEAVTSHGPINPKRHKELNELFENATCGLVMVTAFLSRKAMVKYLSDISWETEVWVAESPDHLIHFNGERFLGPYGG